MEETTESKIFFEELNKEKKAIEKNIKQIEDSIKDNEIKYLLNTFNVGNIFRGWEHIFTSKPNKLNIGIQVKKAHISNNEKLFSQIFEIQQENLINNDNKNNNNLRTNKNYKGLNGTTNENSNSNNYKNNKRKIKTFKSFIGLKKNRNSINKESKQNNLREGNEID